MLIVYQGQCFHALDLLAIGQAADGIPANGTPSYLGSWREGVDGGGQRVPLLENALLRNGQLAATVASTHIELNRWAWRVIRGLVDEVTGVTQRGGQLRQSRL